MGAPTDPPRLLTDAQAAAAREIAALIREGQVAPLVGTGLSLGAGLPSWTTLGEQIIRAWQPTDPDAQRRQMEPGHYLALMRGLFADDLTFTSYLRHRLREPAEFSAFVYRALYGEQTSEGPPRPRDTHRHLVALFAPQPDLLHAGDVWTTNYDDLLEEAARELGHKQLHSLHLADHRAGRGLNVHHLHGYLPPERPGQPVQYYPVVLAEDDYHAVAANMAEAGWIDRTFYHLFETRHVLIVGMSLTDPNLRRVLATLPTRPPGSVGPRHSAVMKVITPEEVAQWDVPSDLCPVLALGVSHERGKHWEDYGVRVVDLADHALLLPFLVRLRYEAHGSARGQLWEAAAAHVTQRLKPWARGQRKRAEMELRTIHQRLTQDFKVSREEIVDVGLFLLAENEVELELVMRVGESPPPTADHRRTFSVAPDAPTGAAGCVFVAGAGMIVSRSDAAYDYGGPAPEGEESAPYEAIIQVPVVDWPAGGLPIGVLYATIRTTEAELLQQPAGELLGWLASFGQDLVGRLQRRARA